MAEVAPGQDIRSRLVETVRHFDHFLPNQASIRDFVHHNTLHGFQHLPFPEALAAASRLTGIHPWLPEDSCREYFRAGRIDASDIADALAQLYPAEALAEVLLAECSPPLNRGELLQAALVHPLAAVPAERLDWLSTERQALSRLADDVPAPARARLLPAGADEATVVAGLWQACLELLGIAADDHEEDRPAPADSQAIAAEARNLRHELEASLGKSRTATGLMKALVAGDLHAAQRPTLIRHLGSHLDQGVAAWHNPARGDGLYAAWRQSARNDPSWSLEGLPDSRGEIDALPADAVDAIIGELTRLGLPEERWPAYLERTALDLPGWAGMLLWREHHPGYADSAGVPVALLDGLAIMLIVERLFGQRASRRYWDADFNLESLRRHFARRPAELIVRHAYRAGDLPDWLAERIAPHLRPASDVAAAAESAWEQLAADVLACRGAAARPGPAGAAWPLFRLAQVLGIPAAALTAAGPAGGERLLAALGELDVHRRGHLWLLAYERHYREQIFSGLAANHGRWRGHPDGPVAQLVFCMDDREEGMRRHLEEIAPEVETLGGAAHFAVFQNYYGLDDSQPTPLCPVAPVVIVPSHNVREVPRPASQPLLAGHRQRRARRLAWLDRLHAATRHGLAGGLALTAAGAPLAFVALLLRSLALAWLGRLNARWRERHDLALATRLEFSAGADAGPATPEAPREGFTDGEQAERIGNYLASLGLTNGFAPLVAIVGHGSNSQNNPHMAAYDCGACAGRHSGANARLFAAMANRPAVRALLRERGIDLPDGTWFLGAEHNTADDLITWYDSEDLPAALRPAYDRLLAALAQASAAHAQERCRRLHSAPLGIAPPAALAHVGRRRDDWGQTRPELGHATNACALIGRRAMSRGAFFDRRAFLISYDPQQDADGRILERHLLINGAVGAGISLEYFFSTANNEGFGCGSKVLHNLAGHFGVMQGAGSDLRTGLPRQMIEIHEAMRLLVVVEQRLDIITAIYQRQPPLQELVGNGWVVVAAKDPDSPALHLFDPARGWLPWAGSPPPGHVARSIDWFAGRREALPPALLDAPLRVAA